MKFFVVGRGVSKSWMDALDVIFVVAAVCCGDAKHQKPKLLATKQKLAIPVDEQLRLEIFKVITKIISMHNNRPLLSRSNKRTKYCIPGTALQ